VGAGDFRAQAHKAFENLRTALAAAGASFEHVVKTNIYLADMSHVATFREVRGNYIREPAPASTLVEARLVRPEWLIEIEAVAVLPD
jgi:enamine deaminase RidA (YjgF/YER057c/UK114 family)